MECMYRNLIGILSYHTRKTLSHIAGCILSKSETEDVRWKIVCCLQDISYTGCEELGLTASWSGDDEYTSVYRLDSMSLLVIEGCEDVGEGFLHIPMI